MRFCELVILVAVAAGAAGCQAGPHPFESDKSTLPPPDLLVPDSVGVQVLPVQGAPGGFGETVAEALQGFDVPASTQSANRGSYRLLGAISARPLDASDLALSIDWVLEDAAGRSLARYRQSEEVPAALWQGGDRQLMREIAYLAAPAVASAIIGERPQLRPDTTILALLGPSAAPPPAPPGAAPATRSRAAPESGPAGPPPDTGGDLFHVAPIEGAPGDGGITLRQTLKHELRKRDVRVMGQPGERTFVIGGTVSLTPAGADQQRVKISWTLTTPGGKKVGSVDQENVVPKGSLDGKWGRVALAVSQGAALGLMDLYAQYRRVAARE